MLLVCRHIACLKIWDFCLWETRPSVCSPLQEPLCCFCSRDEEKDPHLHYSTMMSWSQLHPCVLLLLPVVYSEAAQPAIGRLWSRPHNVPPLSEACNCTPALRRQTKTRRSAVTVHEEDRRQNTRLTSPAPSDLSLSVSDPCPEPPHLWIWTKHTRRTTTADATRSRRVWQPSLFLQPLHLHLVESLDSQI